MNENPYTGVKRGLYQSAQGLLISADANAAANIFRKVSTQVKYSQSTN